MAEGSCQGAFPATSGVPQGSHLGPWCFLLVINSVITGRLLDVGVCCLLFAGDLKIFCHIASPEECDITQQAIVELENW